ncbi:MAG: 4-aminobutyrate aminotransferase, partial [Myxococcaceae bacterium]|nr:4-aminobutyrate aminotransferase [Myxococcaceae bacterium]
LKPFLDDYPFVGDVRGQGLLLALELVKSKETKELLPRSVCKVMFEECLKRGLICLSFDPIFRIQPAMTIDAATIDTVVSILREVFDLVKKQGLWTAA